MLFLTGDDDTVETVAVRAVLLTSADPSVDVVALAQLRILDNDGEHSNLNFLQTEHDSLSFVLSLLVLPVSFSSDNSQSVSESGEVELCLQHSGSLARDAFVFINPQPETATGNDVGKIADS